MHTFPKFLVVPALLLSFCAVTLGSGPDSACLQNAVDSSLEGTVDMNGNPTTNISRIAGITYDRCVAACGTGPVDFDWSSFSSQFTSWVIPGLALISQLPYGSRDALSNCLAVLLTVGSPTLAAYSLALAVISNRWMIKRFELSNYPNSHLAAQTLGELQQVSLVFPEEEFVLPSLIVLPDNKIWWQKLAHGLDYSVPTWTLASIASVLFIVLADIFNWVDFLSGILPETLMIKGGITSTLWLCFLPILVGYLRLSPKSDCNRIRKAFDNANSSFHVATDNGVPKPVHGSLSINVRTACRDPIDEDEISSAPIFFYAKAIKWLCMAREVADRFDAASQHASDDRVNGVPPSRRQQVVEYCTSEYRMEGGMDEFLNIFLVSAFFAILLQWGTTGAGVMAMYLSYPIGLGCYSGTYLLYACVSTLIWLLCVISSILSYTYFVSKKRTATSRIIWGLSITFRRLAKGLATLNTIWLCFVAMYQYTNLGNNCWCNSTKFSLRQKAYVMVITPSDLQRSQQIIWTGAFVMSFFSVGLFLIATNLVIAPSGHKIRTPKL